jgi:Double zinc ribbon
MAVAKGETRNCPYCKEEIKPEATKCKHCGSWVSPERPLHKGTCPYCREQIHPEAIKCKHCGSNLVAEEISKSGCGCKEQGSTARLAADTLVATRAQVMGYRLRSAIISDPDAPPLPIGICICECF